jgi:predicted nuclease with TOPRIM domain
MTLLGKAFSVIIMLLSLVFMVLALAVNASHRNWRDVVLGPEGYKSQIETISRENEQLADSKTRVQSALDREQAARRTALAAMQTQQDQLEGELEAALSQNQQLEAKNTELSQLDLARAEELQKLTEETRRLRQQIREEQAKRDKLFTETLELTNNMNFLKGVRQELELRNKALMKQNTRYKEVVDAKGIDITVPLHGAPPKRNGNILVVNRPKDLVEVSIGEDDGLRNGHMLEVTRQGRYVGKLRVRNVEPNRSVAEIMRDYSEGIILEGDRVDTTLE